jgi:hypothetical protein
MTTHLEWDRLNDFADGRLSGDVATDTRVHLAGCADCREAVESIRALGMTGRALPTAIDPPEALWRDVAASIAAGGDRRAVPAAREVTVSATTSPAVSRGGAPPIVTRHEVRSARALPSARWLAAAAVLLMAVSSGVTALFMRRGAEAPSPSVAAGDRTPLLRAAPDGIAPALPAAFAATEAAYLDDVAELQATFAAQRSTLAPATIAVVERSLAAIDAAIAEARTALLADPANQALAELLSSSYRHKVELLRRAAESSQSL